MAPLSKQSASLLKSTRHPRRVRAQSSPRGDGGSGFVSGPGRCLLALMCLMLLALGCSDKSGSNAGGGEPAQGDDGPGDTPDAGGDPVEDEVTDEPPACPEGQALVGDVCVDLVCEPNENVCREGELYVCNGSGTEVVPAPSGMCPGRTCIEGECRPIKHNVVLLFDTSSSMNSCVDNSGDSYYDCCGADCPAEWPVCETQDNPLSRLGHSKALFQSFFSNSRVRDAGRFALLTFPQTEIPFNNGCSSSIYDFNSTITGDEDEHETPQDAWFEANMSEVVRVPFSESWSEDNVDDLLSWVDFIEEPDANPELRATGFTPLGRSMFYAGEYFRHRVIAEGRPCSADAECGSQDYVCVDGACTDPVKHCRLNILLVFTDGQESNAPHIDEFYNPVVQARRMKFGLSCSSDSECLADATCEDGYCRRGVTLLDPCTTDNECPTDAFCEEGRCTVPGFLWPTDQGRCAQAGNTCIVDGDPEECAGFLEQCVPIDPLFVDEEQGANVLRAHNGEPISVTTHVINVSDFDNESRLIASHGGGLHFKVDLSDTETLLGILDRIADYKFGLECELEEAP